MRTAPRMYTARGMTISRRGASTGDVLQALLSGSGVSQVDSSPRATASDGCAGGPIRSFSRAVQRSGRRGAGRGRRVACCRVRVRSGLGLGEGKGEGTGRAALARHGEGAPELLGEQAHQLQAERIALA